MAKTCPACGKPASGKFCSHCGASLSLTRACAKCENEIPPGGRFCNRCGTPASGSVQPSAAGVSSSPEDTSVFAKIAPILGAVAALVVLVVVLVFVIPGLRQPAPTAAPPFASTSGAVGNPAAIDLDTIPPEQAAYQLFARVMASVAEGDSVAARGFAPMAIQAYGLVAELDLDAHYHVALLHLVNNDAAGARRTAAIMLDLVPTHLFGLYTAAQAEQAMSNRDTALTFYRQFLENYDAELAEDRFEYTEHERVLPAMRVDAQRIVSAAPP